MCNRCNADAVQMLCILSDGRRFCRQVHSIHWSYKIVKSTAWRMDICSYHCDGIRSELFGLGTAHLIWQWRNNLPWRKFLVSLHDSLLGEYTIVTVHLVTCSWTLMLATWSGRQLLGLNVDYLGKSCQLVYYHQSVWSPWWVHAGSKFTTRFRRQTPV